MAGAATAPAPVARAAATPPLRTSRRFISASLRIYEYYFDFL
jgi:hypothetical protein